MASEPRNKTVKIRLTPTENDLAEQLALNERITVSELMRSRTFTEAPLPNATSLQFLKKTSRTLAQIHQYLAENSEPEETCKLLQKVRDELNEARTLIGSPSINSSV